MQSQGIGSRMMAALESYLRDEQVHEVLTFMANNAGANRFFMLRHMYAPAATAS